ncbi:histidine phosphatase family protein [Endozoicomonas numazuensis]|uniref:histidine phosphatase family protein n=1 Tax=Endozoicomonas numazuensis TaxID=1137799 RepID=UPI000AF8F310|nr:histidine phosphatase family protein [Endozoicomonas numazuensis]
MAELHIFRHGETEWNLEGRMQGSQDSPLTELGKSQAIAARSKIESIEFDAVYSSSSARAYDTAQLLLGDRQIPVQQLDELKEISMGTWEGMTYKEVEKEYAQDHFHFWKQPSLFRGEGAESFHQLENRSVSVIKQIISQHQDQKVLVVSHGAFIKTLLTSLQSRPLDEIWEGPYAKNLCHSIVLGPDVKVKQYCDEDWGNNS